MTREEKAKAYDEALEKAKKALKTDIHESGIWAIQRIFPQLRESEDERIRKELVEAFEALDIDSSWNGIPVKSILAWLKDQKPAEWSKNDTVFLNEITDFFENKTVRLQHDIDMYAHWLKSLPERFVLQPKQEWSDEDERMIGRIRSVVNECASYNDALDVNGDYCEGDYAKLDAWLKSLPERKNLPPKQEWNKEDERMLKWIEDILLIADDDLSDKLNGKVRPITDSAYSSMKICIAKCRSWLKSLRPQPKAELTLLDENIIKAAVAFIEQNDHFNCWGGIDKHMVLKALRSLRPSWKPSEEQMKAMSYFVRKHQATANRATTKWPEFEAFKSLYNDLKKRM